jgi:nucleoside-diphosphate-sugar epimerase
MPVDETHSTAPQRAYALSKKQGKDMADVFCRNHPTVFASFRLANVRAPCQYDVYLDRRRDAASHAPAHWSYVDARDVGQSCRRLWDSKITGHTVFNLSAAGNWLDQNVESVIADSARSDVALQDGFGVDPTGWVIFRARDLLGYQPEHSWRQYL